MKALKATMIVIGMMGTWAGVYSVNAAQRFESNKNVPLMIAQAQTYEGKGIVKNIDMQAKKITIAHEAIKAIGWHAMTMSFDVEDAGTLNKVKSGDKIYFEFYQGRDNRIVVTDIEVQ